MNPNNYSPPQLHDDTVWHLQRDAIRPIKGIVLQKQPGYTHGITWYKRSIKTDKAEIESEKLYNNAISN